MARAPALKSDAGLRDGWGRLAAGFLALALFSATAGCWDEDPAPPAELRGRLAAWCVAALVAVLALRVPRTSALSDTAFAGAWFVAAHTINATSPEEHLLGNAGSMQHGYAAAACVLALATAGVHTFAVAALWVVLALLSLPAGGALEEDARPLAPLALGLLGLAVAATTELRTARLCDALARARRGGAAVVGHAMDGSGRIAADSGAILGLSEGLRWILGPEACEGALLSDLVLAEDREALVRLRHECRGGRPGSVVVALRMRGAGATAPGEATYQETRIVQHEASDNSIDFCIRLLGRPFAHGGVPPPPEPPPPDQLQAARESADANGERSPSTPERTFVWTVEPPEPQLQALFHQPRSIHHLAPPPPQFHEFGRPSAGSHAGLSDMSSSRGDSSRVPMDQRSIVTVSSTTVANSSRASSSEPTRPGSSEVSFAVSCADRRNERGAQTDEPWPQLDAESQTGGGAGGEGGDRSAWRLTDAPVAMTESSTAFEAVTGAPPPPGAVAVEAGKDPAAPMRPDNFADTPPSTCTVSLQWAMLHWNIPMNASMCCTWHNSLEVALRLLALRRNSPCDDRRPLGGCWQCATCGSLNPKAADACDLCREHRGGGSSTPCSTCIDARSRSDEASTKVSL